MPTTWLVVNGKNENPSISLKEEDIVDSAKTHKCTSSFYINIKQDEGITECCATIVAAAVEQRFATPVSNILRNPISSKLLANTKNPSYR
jgi:hypothetical protein